MSCLTHKFEPVGGDTKITAARISDFQFRFALVCGTHIGGYEYLYASDGILLTVDNGVIMVKKMI